MIYQGILMLLVYSQVLCGMKIVVSRELRMVMLSQRIGKVNSLKNSINQTFTRGSAVLKRK